MSPANEALYAQLLEQAKADQAAQQVRLQHLWPVLDAAKAEVVEVRAEVPA